MSSVGYLALIISIILSLYTAYSFYVGNKDRKGQKQQKAGNDGIVWQFTSVTFASLILFTAFLTNDFSFQYVASHSTTEMGTFYKIAAFWAGHEGSLLLWLWMLTGLTAIIAFFNKKNDRLTNVALYVANYIQLFLLVTILLATNPFKPAMVGMPPTGAGLNPLLMHWAMILHPPTLFMGYAGITIPFAFAIAALIERNSSADWIDRSHKWTLFAWLFLTIGIFLGALWAYVVLGWGGYWAWDPVENASILPWFAGTALLHTFTMYRRRGGMKVWAVSLTTLAFVMTILATFITRSGLIQSVHAFPELRWDLTLLFGGLMVGAAGLTMYLVNTRRQEFETQEFFNDFLSRHFTYYLNNVALVAFTLIIAGGTVIPPFFGQALGADFYNRLAQPLGILYLLLVTVCPFLGWTKTDSNRLLKQLAVPFGVVAAAAIPLYMQWGSNIMGFLTIVVAVFSTVAILVLFYLSASTRAKNRGIGFVSALAAMFKYNRGMAGGYIGHLGIAILIFGIAGSMLYVQDIPAVIKAQPGQTVKAGNYELTLKDFKQSTRPGQQVSSVVFDMRDLTKGNKLVGQVAPNLVFHNVQQQQTMEASVHYEPFRDIFVVINNIDQQGNIALNIKINPLISFVWIGSFVLVFGTIIAMWPKAVAVTQEETQEAKSSSKAARKRKEQLSEA